MGISGLLPLLKPIQVTRHLSEFSGQTLAIDGYGWLHRGAYACAAELATGKPTHKYVDFAMHRVRLLRHHGIQPYIVFDGGPLPAKIGTEVERERRRQENLMRANALASQGKHTQAREFYVKCVDVTPEMAYQLIKALKAESVPYVVAPYEADAQMAYLEQIDLVDGIITEDSDLLVFGCKSVLLKLDVVASTVVCISRCDFASLDVSDSSGISLRGWSDKEFRTMAILSGCDYLPSIPGIGLKTAWALLRKWKTVENVIRSVKLEGKKKVPKEYLDNFYMAERCFLHQRVYDPCQERLVHLSDVSAEWTELCDEYVGKNLDPLIAKKIAEGDIDPISYRPMRDIHPTYQPGLVKAKLLMSSDTNRKNKGKTKTPDRKGLTIADFFGPNPTIPPVHKAKTSKGSPGKAPRTVGKASGKRTLTGAMELDIAAKKPRVSVAQPEKIVPSRFFDDSVTSTTPSPRRYRNRATSSQVTLDDEADISLSDEKENFCEEPNAVGTLDVEEISALSFKVQGVEDFDLDLEDAVGQADAAQEDDYRSPSPSLARWETPELSSPVRGKQPRSQGETDCSDFIPSPGVKRNAHQLHSKISLLDGHFPLPDPNEPALDLRDSFSDLSSEDELSGYDELPLTPTMPPVSQRGERIMKHASAPTVIPPTGDLEEFSKASSARLQAVARGWREKWALDGAPARRQDFIPLRRRETTVTPGGKDRSIRPCTVPRLSLSRVAPPISGYKRRSLAKSYSHSEGEGSSGKAELTLPQVYAIDSGTNAKAGSNLTDVEYDV